MPRSQEEAMSPTHFFRRFVLVLVLAGSASLAQDSFGKITGNITDSSGASVAGAMVRATNTSTNMATRT